VRLITSRPRPSSSSDLARWANATAFYAQQTGDGRTTLVLEGLFSGHFSQPTQPAKPWPVLARFSEAGQLIETHVSSDGEPIPAAPP
jgi:hypothetical protein